MLAPATGWDGGRGRGQRRVSGQPSCPGSKSAQSGSPRVTAWTKAQRGCQLVLVACAFRSCSHRSKAHWHVRHMVQGPQLTGPCRLHSFEAAQALTLSSLEPGPWERAASRRGFSFPSRPQPQQSGEVLQNHPHLSLRWFYPPQKPGMPSFTCGCISFIPTLRGRS